MANLLLSNGLPAPGPLSGWYARTGRYGPTIQSSTSRQPRIATPHSYSFANPFLQGANLPTWRRRWFSFISRAWTTALNFDKASFLDHTYTFTNLTGHTVTATGYELFKHYADTCGPDKNWFHYHGGDGSFTLPFFQAQDLDSEPAPPAIVSASWDGTNIPSITLSNYLNDPHDIWGYQLMVTPPGILTPDTNNVLTIGVWEPFTGSTDVFNQSVVPPSTFLLPWPFNSECLLGIRVFPADPQFYLPSPWAAVGIQIGS